MGHQWWTAGLRVSGRHSAGVGGQADSLRDVGAPRLRPTDSSWEGRVVAPAARPRPAVQHGRLGGFRSAIRRALRSTVDRARTRQVARSATEPRRGNPTVLRAYASRIERTATAHVTGRRRHVLPWDERHRAASTRPAGGTTVVGDGLPDRTPERVGGDSGSPLRRRQEGWLNRRRGEDAGSVPRPEEEGRQGRR